METPLVPAITIRLAQAAEPAGTKLYPVIFTEHRKSVPIGAVRLPPLKLSPIPE